VKAFSELLIDAFESFFAKHLKFLCESLIELLVKAFESFLVKILKALLQNFKSFFANLFIDFRQIFFELFLKA
jgi:hypothetical protein